MTLSVDTGRVSVTPPNDRQVWRAQRATLSLDDYVDGILFEKRWA
jgi:hypothetical protein